MPKLLRLGVGGCGGHAISHMEVAHRAGFVVAGLYDPDRQSVQRALDALAALGQPKPVVFDSLEAMLASDQIDAVMLVSPDRFHARQLRLAVQAGKPVFVEKPLGITRRDMWSIRGSLRMARRKRVPVTSCHQRRKDRPYGWAKHQLPELIRRFGPLVQIELDFSYHAPVAKWKHTRSLLMDHWPHEIDFMRFLLGDRGFRAQRWVDRHDYYCVTGVFDTGVTFVCTGTRMLEARTFPEEIRLRFARGTMEINTKTGGVGLYNHQTQERTFDRAVPTDYDGRNLDVTVDFAHMIETGQGYLSHADLIVNTESAIRLSGWRGQFRYRP